MRILATTPMHPDYGIKPQALVSIHKAVSNYDGPIDWLISAGDNPYDSPFENVAYQHNKARQMVIDDGYDAMFSVEADMIIPPDTISLLLEADADIAYGLYVSRHKPNRWLAFKNLTLWGGESVSLDYTGKNAREAWGKIIDVAGVGMGCALIRREVLEQLEFRLHDGKHSWIQDEYADDFRQMGFSPYSDHRNMVCDDYLLAMDAQHYGMSQRTNMNVICGHINGKGVIWPDLEAKSFFRIESIEEH
jgi:hypothetical protein